VPSAAAARAVAETPWAQPEPGTRAAPSPRPTRWEYLDARTPVEPYPLEPGVPNAFDAALAAALAEYGRED
jgi:hypothetical protein